MNDILREGRNCWKMARADRLTFLVDAAAFYSAVAAALQRAQRSVMILGWDFDPRVRLERGDGDSRDLAELLEAAVRRRRQLRVYILEWDFTLLYTFGGESRPLFSRSRIRHRRIQRRVDANHPTGGSHHQKIVVVDDRLAFVGGLDFRTGRWDTPRHRPHDPRRKEPGGEPYPPFHDVQVAVSGPVAAALGELTRERWRRATGRRLQPPRTAGDPWPPHLRADVEAVMVAVARTEPALAFAPEIREVERLYLDSISAARRWIYLESQYLTSDVIADAIARRLEESNGPEVVVVLPRDSSGWLEQGTMDVLRARVLRRLRRGSGSHRLRVYHPVSTDRGETVPIYVHSKVMVVDDSLARVGSSNISNRSMGLDTECDLALEAGGDPRLERAIAGLRERLLAEHLGTSAESLRQSLEATGSLIETVERYRDAGRTLQVLEHEPPEWLMHALPDRDVIDPERPIDLERWIDLQVPGSAKRLAGGRLVGIALVAVFAGLITIALSLTPLGSWLAPEHIADILPLRAGLAGPLILAVAYLAGCMILIPVTLLALATFLIYGPLWGLAYSALGIATGAAATYAIGRRLSPDTVRRLSRSRINRISGELVRKGFLGMLTLRLLPLASFSLVSYMAGAARVRFGDFTLSTVLGLAPLLFAVAIFADRLEAAVARPGLLNLTLLVLVVLGIASATFIFGRWLWRRGLAAAAAAAGDRVD
jgi:phosphatidylserine/phosphatidylglycerophosphate/cardiolipin synthase-like enzyme